MKSIFEKAIRDELISRVDALGDNSGAVWGKMNVYQMVRHCRLWDEMILRNDTHPRVLAGRIFGKMALKSVLKDEAPLRKNTPTVPALIISGDGDLVIEKGKWTARIKDYGGYNHSSFNHPFFGTMTREQIGYLVYKHADHHLRQFGA